jgi:pimeloyl-ACP methyl ester carboxylesterase
MVADDYGPKWPSAWTTVDWAEHQRWVTIDERRVNLIDIGEGPPLVFVHGLGGSWQNWLENVVAFSSEHRVIAVDLPGFGHSEMPADRITISGYGAWLDRLFDALEIEAAAVVGNSMGGFIAAETAITFPHRVERLVLVAAAGVSQHELRNPHVLRALEATENLAQMVTAWGLSQLDFLSARPRGRQVLMAFVTAHPEKLPGPLVVEQARGAGKPGFLPALDALTDYPIADRLSEIGCPTLIVWGPKDKLVPIRDAYEFNRLIPDSRLLVYEDTGHMPMLERPERFNDDLRAFLSEQPDDEDERLAAATD